MEDHTKDYAAFWDKQYFVDFYLTKSGNLWDVPANYSVALDEPFFVDYFNPQLPIVDIGCGTGSESIYLSRKYERVIGVEISKRALSLARAAAEQENSKVTWMYLDVLDRPSLLNFKEELGDVNIYMRGVLHQIKEEHRREFCEALVYLAGAGGVIYINEVAEGLKQYLESHDDFKALPERMKQVFTSNLPPVGVRGDILEDLFSHITNVFNVQDQYIQTSLIFRSGEPIKIPSVTCLLSQKPYI